tara:strand:- start:795 stop:920 length:126 start_codon:yes stop_codon:yes gene_type:complete
VKLKCFATNLAIVLLPDEEGPSIATLTFFFKRKFLQNYNFL